MSWHEITVENRPGFGCVAALSPDGSLVACVSAREILLARPATGEVVHRRPMERLGEELVPVLGSRPHRLLCTAAGEVIWLRGRRATDPNWSAPRLRYLPQEGLCDDIAHDGDRLAMASDSGLVTVCAIRPSL